MRRIVFLLTIVLFFTAVAPAASRLDLLSGTAENPSAPGYRIAVGGSPILSVFPLDENRARIATAGGETREIDLPVVSPYRPTLSLFAWRTPDIVPVFAVESWATTLDGLSLLMSRALVETGNSSLRFGVTLWLHTDAGRVGNWRTQIVERSRYLPGDKWDALLEQFFLAGPLPPLAGGDALCRVEVLAVGGDRPRLSVWIGKPYLPDSDGDRLLDGGVLLQEPLDPLAAVRDCPGIEAVRQTFTANRQAALNHLLAEQSRSDARLFGGWHLEQKTALAQVNQSLTTAQPDQADSLLWIGAWALANDRRTSDALNWLNTLVANSRNRALAEDAAFLSLAWRKRLLRPVAGDSIVQTFKNRNEWEMRLAALPYAPPEQRLNEARRMLSALRSNHAARADAALLQSSLIWEAAQGLAALCGTCTPEQVLLSANRLLPAGEATDRIAFNAAALLARQGSYSRAAEMYRYLLAIDSASSLAPQAAWGLVSALAAAGDREEALDAALALAAQFGPESRWQMRRGANDAAPWAHGLGGRIEGVGDIRRQALRLVRDARLTEYLDRNEPSNLRAAEEAASLLLDSAAAEDARADWIMLGRIRWISGDAAGAATAYGNASLAATEDELRLEALHAQSACLQPDAARVAAALADDPTLGPYLAALLR